MRTSQQSKFQVSVFFATALLLFSFGCNKNDDESEYQPTESDRQAAAEMVADGFASDNDGEYYDITTTVTNPINESKGASKVSIDTSITTPRGLELKLYRKFVNASGDSSDTYSTEFNKLYVKRDLSGVVQKLLRSFYMEVSRHTIFTVEGLGTASSAWIINGTRTAHYYQSFSSRFDTTASFSYERNLTDGKATNIIINKNDGDKYPESGELSYTLDITKTKSKNDKTKVASFSVTAKITFNGTNKPTLEILDRQGHRLRYKVNVESGDLSAVAL